MTIKLKLAWDAATSFLCWLNFKVYGLTASMCSNNAVEMPAKCLFYFIFIRTLFAISHAFGLNVLLIAVCTRSGFEVFCLRALELTI